MTSPLARGYFSLPAFDSTKPPQALRRHRKVVDFRRYFVFFTVPNSNRLDFLFNRLMAHKANIQAPLLLKALL
jgi:hypothetical protein